MKFWSKVFGHSEVINIQQHLWPPILHFASSGIELFFVTLPVFSTNNLINHYIRKFGIFPAFWDSYKYKNMDKITQILENVVRCKYVEAGVHIKNPIKNSYEDGLGRTTQTLDHVVVVHIWIWDKRKSQINEYSDTRQMGLKQLLFQTSPLFLEYETRDWMRWLANPNRGCGHFPHNFWSSYEYYVIQ